MSSSFFPAPPEVVSRIFQSCEDFADVLALAATCKRLQTIWIVETRTIIWEVGRASLLSFDEALIAVRSTQIIQECFVPDGPIFDVTSPPDIDIPLLSGQSRKPTLPELKAILDLRHLVRYLEHTALLLTRVEDSWGRGATHLLDEAPHLLPSWREGFYRAAYTSFVAGSVLAKFYLDPILNTRSERGSFLESPTCELAAETDYHDGRITEFPLEDYELEILDEYPIYNFTPHEDWVSCFGAFGDWLIGGIRQRLNIPESKDSQPSDREGEVLKEVLQLLIMYGQLSDMKGSLLDSDIEPVWSRHRSAPHGRCSCSKAREEYDDDLYEAKQQKLLTAHTRTVPVVFLGDYVPQLVELSTDRSEFGKETCAFNVPDRDTELTMLPELVDLCRIMNCMSQRPNHTNGHPAPHPPLHLFSFLLREYFDYQFDELAFEVNTAHPVYENFIRRGKIFSSEGGNWDGLLTSVYPPHELSFKELGWADMTY